MILYQATHKANFNWIEPVMCTKTWKLMKMIKLMKETLQWKSDWYDDKHKGRTSNYYIMCLCDGGSIVWKFYLQTMVMSSREEKKRAISSAVMFVLQVLRKMNKPVAIPTEVLMDGKGLIYMSEGTSRSIRTGHVEARLRMLQEQVADLVVEIKCVKTDGNIVDSTVRVEVFEGHSKDSVRDKQECEAPTHPTETELREMNSEVQHWSSVGRVSEIYVDPGTDARGDSYPILSGYSVDRVSFPEQESEQAPRVEVLLVLRVLYRPILSVNTGLPAKPVPEECLHRLAHYSRNSRVAIQSHFDSRIDKV